jgi:hypothetical protein
LWYQTLKPEILAASSSAIWPTKYRDVLPRLVLALTGIEYVKHVKEGKISNVLINIVIVILRPLMGHRVLSFNDSFLQLNNGLYIGQHGK